MNKDLTQIISKSIKKYSKKVFGGIMYLEDRSLDYLKNISLPNRRGLLLSAAALGFSISAISGCASKQMVKKQLALTPQYFQDNVGEAHILPFYSAITPILGGPVAWLNKSDPNGSYTLTALADKNVLLHEAFHSFDFRTGLKNIPRDKLPSKITLDFIKKHRPPKEWQNFAYDFSQGNPPKPNLPIHLICMALPGVRDIPVPGHIRLYGCSTGAEDAADCFVFYIRGKKRNDKELMRKCEIVGQYARGEYGSQKK